MARATKPEKAEDAADIIVERQYGPPHDTQIQKPASHKPPPDKRGVKTAPIRGPPIERAAYSIDEFAAAHGLSVAMYFKLRNLGLGPDEMRVGRRRLISFEAAERWRRQREKATPNTAA
jgi:hypothetical protein